MPFRALLTSLALLVAPPLEALGDSGEDRSPALVLLLAVDQLRPERLSPSLPGGLGRLAREGRVYLDAVLDHATTETCPGHATMLTGRHPGPAGVVGNTFIDRKTGERVYCVEDRSPAGAVFGGEGGPASGRSPRNLRVEALGDWMKRAHPETKVFGISAKDRSAITLSGKGPDAVYWFLRGERPGFTTSRYYLAALPAWVAAWNGPDPSSGFLANLPDTWTHGVAPIPGLAAPRPDDFPGESDERSRTSPHPLRAASGKEFAENVYVSPYMDLLTLRFAKELVVRERVGVGSTPDLLALSLSATDKVGHEYGPYSQESRDALERLDAALGTFLSFLDARFGEGRVVVALTSDHGVLPLPEWQLQQGTGKCPVPGGRQGLISLIVGFLWELHRELSLFSWPQPWMQISTQLTVDRALAAKRGVPPEEVVRVAEHWLEAHPSVREAWTRAEIQSREGPFAELYRHAFDDERSGDLAIQVEPTCRLGRRDVGTGHGTPYEYDRAVPLVFFGPGVPTGQLEVRAATIDIAPTLAGLIGLEAPPGLDGRDLLRPDR